MRVLVVEDEEYLAEAIATGLRREAMASARYSSSSTTSTRIALPPSLWILSAGPSANQHPCCHNISEFVNPVATPLPVGCSPNERTPPRPDPREPKGPLP